MRPCSHCPPGPGIRFPSLQPEDRADRTGGRNPSRLCTKINPDRRHFYKCSLTGVTRTERARLRTAARPPKGGPSGGGGERSIPGWARAGPPRDPAPAAHGPSVLPPARLARPALGTAVLGEAVREFRSGFDPGVGGHPPSLPETSSCRFPVTAACCQAGSDPSPKNPAWVWGFA